ncbi:MAG TPA: Spy/CpxP family protein refolding chaperone [Pyrinomonadaceae bacterium]|nr:Spy/CpxP family protein refolding chaperone [Pyrinomonadaceae bacterium]
MKVNLRKTGLAGIAGLVLLIAAVLAVSQQRPNGDFRGGPGPRDGLGPFGRDLNLTDDQKTQIKKIQDSFRESDKALFDQLRTLRENEPDPMNGSFDEAAVRAAAEAKAKIQIELDVSRAKMMSQIASVLTDQQKAQLAAKRKQFGRQGGPPPTAHP